MPRVSFGARASPVRRQKDKSVVGRAHLVLARPLLPLEERRLQLQLLRYWPCISPFILPSVNAMRQSHMPHLNQSYHISISRTPYRCVMPSINETCFRRKGDKPRRRTLGVCLLDTHSPHTVRPCMQESICVREWCDKETLPLQPPACPWPPFLTPSVLVCMWVYMCVCVGVYVCVGEGVAE